MKVLFASTAGAGHFGPLVPFVEGARRGGHDVLVAAPAAFGPFVERAGFPFWPCGDTPPEQWAAVMARLPSLSFEEANNVVIGEVFAGMDARATLPRMQEAVEQWRPDLLVRESAEFGSGIAAEQAGVPQARVGIGLGASEKWMLRVAAEHLAALREEAGLPGDATGGLMGSRPYLTLVPPSMEDPVDPGPEPAYRFRAVHRQPEPLPDWWAGNEDPLVYVTFGTVAPGMPGLGDLYRGVLAALATLPVRILATVGDTVDPATMAAGPNVRVERWIPQGNVLPHAAAMVCHGGFGSVHGALTAGVPLVVVPFFADQPINAQRVAAMGAGLAVTPPDPGEVVKGLLTILGDDSFTLQAERVADDYRQLRPADDFLDVIGTPALRL
ncbi:MAG TPA: glycosyltransferase [Actinomycetota bacterium]|nr:glycosyltransferase [Actinomycetota bacterium]